MAESSNNERQILGIVIIALVAVAGYVGYTALSSEKTVGENDVVQINYIAWYEDGTVFATTIVNEVVTPDTVLDSSHRYRPRAYTISQGTPSKGTSTPILGLQQGLMGMKEGEVKTIVIPPELGFSADPELVSTVSRTFGTFTKEQTGELYFEYDRVLSISLAQYTQAYGATPQVGDVISLVDWDGTVVEVTDSTVSIRGDASVGDIMDMKPWQQEVTEVTDDLIITKGIVEIGGVYENAFGTVEVTGVTEDTVSFTQITLNETYETAYGPADIIDDGNSFRVFLNPEEGAQISTSSGTGTIKNITDTSFSLDFNPAYVGATITFKVIVDKIIKAE